MNDPAVKSRLAPLFQRGKWKYFSHVFASRPERASIGVAAFRSFFKEEEKQGGRFRTKVFHPPLKKGGRGGFKALGYSRQRERMH
jgi:hypothetical protein